MLIPIDEVKPGMRTENSVKLHGRILVGPGVELTERMIVALKALQIREVPVFGATPKVGQEELEQQDGAQEIIKNMNLIFANTNVENELMAEIKRVAVRKALGPIN